MADKDTTEAGRLFLGLYYEDQSAKLTITVHRWEDSIDFKYISSSTNDDIENMPKSFV